MAKKAYVGVNGVARKVKKMYVGVSGRDFFEKAKLYSTGNCSVSNGTVTQAVADTATAPYWRWRVTKTDGTYTDYGQTYTINGVISTSFVKDSTASTLNFGLNGSVRDTTITYDISSLPNGTYTVSAQMLNSTQGSVSWNNMRFVLEDSVAFKIKKAYVGVGGVARPFWGGLSYYGAITSLQSSRSYLMATSVGNYALFGGGYQFGDVSTDDVDVYDSSLTHTILDVYWNHNGQGLSRGAATTVGNVAMFAGGISTDNSTVGQNHGYAYNSSLTGLGRFYLGGKSYDPSATSIGDYALFSHGTSTRYYDPQGTRATKITAINASLTTSTPTAPDTSAGGRASTVVGNYALFAGGTWREEFSDDYTMHYVTIVDAYNSSLTHSTAPALDVSRTLFAGVSISGHALFTGANSSTQTAVVYDSSLTRTLISSTATGSNLKGTTLKSGSEEFAFIGGGGSTTIYVFDTSLTERTAEFNMKFSSSKSNCAATTIGQFAIFAGGSSSDAEAITM